MRLLGHVLMWAGVLLASFVSVSQVAAIGWASYAGALALGLCGVLLLRLTAKSALHQEHQVGEDLAIMRAALTNILVTLDELVDADTRIDVYGIKDRIDDDMAEHLASFADARESMIPAFGLSPYADVMTRFAGGERLVNRAWSASADGYLDEVVTCLRDARGLLIDAKTTFDRCQSEAAKPPRKR